MRIEHAQSGQGLLQLADRTCVGSRGSQDEGGGGVIRVVFERCGVPCGDGTSVEVVLNFTNAVHAISARYVDAVAASRGSGASNEVVALVRCENEQSVG